MNNSHYNQISKAIEYIIQTQNTQPELGQIARAVDLSPYYFQKLFTDYTGVSPKQFLSYLNFRRVKSNLVANQSNLNISIKSGLSSTSRLHDLFVKITAMTPAEYKNGGQNLTIKYSFGQCLFGLFIVASTNRGICELLFGPNEEYLISELMRLWSEAEIINKEDEYQIGVKSFFDFSKQPDKDIKLHLKGSPFQLKVWESLLKIPEGQTMSYGQIAESINFTRAVRAVGTAVGRNPVGYIIPCHRVLQASGVIGEYRWGSNRKKIMLGFEVNRTSNI